MDVRAKRAREFEPLIGWDENLGEAGAPYLVTSNLPISVALRAIFTGLTDAEISRELEVSQDELDITRKYAIHLTR